MRRRFNQATAQYSRPLSKPLLIQNHRMNHLKWACDHKAMNWKQVIFSDETTIRLICIKGLLWNLPEKKIVRTITRPIKVNVWSCYSSKGFSDIVCFKQNLNAELMCDISKRGLLPTASKQSGYDSMLWKLQEENYPKHTWKPAVNWKRNNAALEIQ